MKIYFYIGMSLDKILSRKMYKPIHIFEINEYESYVSEITYDTEKTNMLYYLTKNYTDKIIYKYENLNIFKNEIDNYVKLKNINTRDNKLFFWLLISIESAIDHKMNFYITSDSKK